jgi:hypothetical protein
VTASSWHDFAVMLGGASAALTGLLFVAVSLNAARIAGHRGLRARAAETLVLFFTPLMWSAVVLVPDQLRVVLGAELTLVALLSGAVLLSLSRHRHSLPGDDAVIARFIAAPAPNLITTSTLAISGILVAAHWYEGLYVAVAPLIAAIATGVVTAWLFLLPPTPKDPDGRQPDGSG